MGATTVMCQDCTGSGKDYVKRQLVIDGVSTTKTVIEDCKRCGGSGRVVENEDPPKDGRYR
jgi:DnaJ-class molecular chaperone